MLDSPFTIKNNELCLVGSDVVRGAGREAGLFLRDTRFLSRFDLSIAGEPWDVLAVRAVNEQEIVFTLGNPEVTIGGTRIRAHEVSAILQVRLTDNLEVSLHVTSHASDHIRVPIGLTIGTDFQDMFDVRGMTPDRRVVPSRPQLEGDDAVRLSTDTDAALTAHWHSALASVDTALSDDEVPEATVVLGFDLDLEPGATTSLPLSLSPRAVGAAHVPLENLSHEPAFAAGRIAADDPDWRPFVDRCDRDLAMLFTSFPEGAMPAAGIPWFISPFGRDSLIVALQTLDAYPERATATLRVLAALQGDKIDPFREEEPGKILHEMRYGFMAQTGQIPHAPYFGSIDSTPLFIMVAARYARTRPDDPLIDDLYPALRRAAGWCIAKGEESGDGLLRYRGTARGRAHISQQGWKDSSDSLHFAGGQGAEGPIALVEVQGYLYAAFAGLAALARSRGDTAWADDLASRADAIRRQVEERFWLDDAGFYAQALDGRGRQVDAISSNPGHLLFCGLPSAERASRVAGWFAEDDLLTPWGLRTLSSRMATYNPASYHNGSVWPHDTSLAMAGLDAYGHHDLARTLAEALRFTASFDPQWRLDELYCGYVDNSAAGPVRYPVSCRPQAWAAGAGVLAWTTLQRGAA